MISYNFRIMSMISEYNSGTKLVLQKVFCQSDPESDMKS